MYKITEYTKKQAKRLGVVVKPSSVVGKKIDVFTNQNSEDPFSAGSGGAQTGNSSKPDYF